MLRRVEARLQSGISHRRYGKILLGTGNDDAAQQCFADSLKDLQKAAGLWKPGVAPSIRARISEQIAVVHIIQGRFSAAREQVQVARTYIQNGETLRDGHVYGLRAAQIMFQEALCDFGEGNDLQGCLKLQQAFHLLPDSPRAQRSRETFQRLGREEIKKITDRGRLQELEAETKRAADEEQIRTTAWLEMERVFREARD